MSQIITSFGEGAFTYNPFRRKIDLDRNNNGSYSSNNNNNNNNITTRPITRRRRRSSNANRNNDNSSSNKRRLYGLEPGRPRPFYGISSLNNDNLAFTRHYSPKTLQVPYHLPSIRRLTKVPIKF